jgi:hypothetical protein
MKPRMRAGAIALGLACLAACAQKPVPAEPVASAAAGCLAAGDGRLQAQLRGAIVADIDWNNAQMECDGGPRPDGSGLRVAIAGALDAQRRLRFIFGVDSVDVADGPAQVMPTNLTVIIEGQSQVFATRGDGHCAVENLERAALGAGQQRVTARGYCIGPAGDLSGEAPLFVPTFSFTALVRDDPADAPGVP